MKNNNMLCKHPPAVNFLRRYALVILLGLLVLLFSLKTTSFFTGRNLSNVLIVQVTTGCMSIGALLVLIVNEFDLSLGYLLGFCMMLGAWMSKVGFSAGVIIPAMLLASAGAGLVSGIMTVKCKVSSFISTLAVGITLSGFTTGLSGGSVLSRNIPTAIINFGQKRFIGVGYDEIFRIMRKGDIVCHIFQGDNQNNILGGSDHIEDYVYEGREKGILFDCACGRVNYSNQIMKTAFAEGFWPDIVSTDIIGFSIYGPKIHSLLSVMSQYLAMGMPLNDLVRAVTATPAHIMGLSNQIGTLEPGAKADIFITKLVENPMDITDKFGRTVHLNMTFVPLLTLKEGQLAYRSIQFDSFA